MKKRSVFTWLIVLTVLSFVLTACVPAATPTAAPPVQPTNPPAVQPTVEQPAQPAATEPPAQPATQAPAAAEPVTLKIMDNWDNPGDPKANALTSILKEVQEKYPEIKIEEEVFADTDIPTKVTTAFVAGEEPDLVFQNYPYGGTGDWIANGVAIPVQDLMQKWGLKDIFLEKAIEQYTDNQGNIVSFPVEGFTWPMWYNMALFKKAGIDAPPQTVDEMVSDAKKLRDAGIQPLVVGGGDWSGQAIFTFINTTVMTDQEFADTYTNGTFSSSPSFMKSLDVFLKLRDNKVFVDHVEGLDYNAMTQMFYQGKAAMMMEGSWGYANLPKEMAQDVVVAGFPIPDGSPRAKPIVEVGYIGKGIWITRNGAKKLDAVEKFVKTFYEPANMARFVEEAAMVSPLKDTPIDQSKLAPLFIQSLKWGDSVSWVPPIDPYVPGTAWDDFTKVTAEAFLPGTKADKIAKDLEEVWAAHK